MQNCEICNGKTQVFTSRIRPESSEFYCPKCHKSYRMPVDVAERLIAQERQYAQTR